MDNPWFYLAAIPAITLNGLAKGGFSGVSLLAMPIMATVASPIWAASVLLPLILVQDLITVWSFRRQWDRRNMLILAPGAVVGTGLAYYFAATVSDRGIALVIGVLAVGFALKGLLRGKNLTMPPTSARVLPGLFWGTAIGFSSFFASAGGPLFQIFVVPQRLSRDLFVGTSGVFFALVNWLKIIPFLALGQLTKASLVESLILLPVALLSIWAGIWLVRRVPVERFYTMIYALLLIVGTKLIYDGVFASYYT